MSDDELSESVEAGSNNIVEGVNQLKQGLQYLSRSLGIWLNRHPFLKWLIVPTVSALIGGFTLRILARGHEFFFGAVAPISRDVKVTVFPAPVGFTLWILSTAFILFAILGYFRFVILRQQIEDLESQIQD
jgi:hypothetical protein